MICSFCHVGSKYDYISVKVVCDAVAISKYIIFGEKDRKQERTVVK